MRVCLVAETFLPSVNGVVNSVLQAADQLARNGHQPVIVAPTGAPFVTPSGYPVDVVTVRSHALAGYRGLRIAAPGLDLAPVLRDLDPDVVHLASPASLGWAAVRAAQRIDVPAVAAFQTDLSGFLRRYHLGIASSALWAGLRRLHNLADLTLAPSTAATYQLRARGIGPVATWARGVDGELFTPRRRDEPTRASLAGGRVLVGFVGRLAAEKRVELLEPLSRAPGVQLVIIGDGPRRASLERLMPRARFLGMQTGTDLAAAVANLDLLVNPGADETFCQVVQEALCSGVPVVAAASGGPLDLVRHGENGWLWSGDDPEVLAALVATVTEDQLGLARVRRRTRPSVVERTWSRLGHELIGHYRQVLDARRAAAHVA